MTKIFTLSIFFFCCFFNLKAQITFQKTYGGGGDDRAYAILQNEDNGYVIAGLTNSFGAGDWDLYMIKLSETGDTLWTRTIGKATAEVGAGVVETVDSGYIVLSSGAPGTLLTKITKDGDSVWTKSMDGVGHSITKTFENNYMIAGQIAGVSGYQIYLIRITDSGDTLWTKSFGTINTDNALAVKQTPDSGFIITGNTRIDSAVNNIFLSKTDSSGNALWMKAYGCPENEHGLSVQLTPDSGYMVAGFTTDSNGLDTYSYLIRTNSSGDTLWTKAYAMMSPWNYSYSLVPTFDKGFAICGMTGISNNSFAYLMKIDSMGVPEWTKTYDGLGNASAYGLIQCKDSGYAMIGSSDNFNIADYDVYFIKTDMNGNTACNSITSTTTTVNHVTEDSTLSFSYSYLFITSVVAAVTFSSGCNPITLCTSVDIPNPVASANTYTISPNPVSVELKIVSEESKIQSIEILSLLGEEIYSSAVICQQLTVPCELFKPGFYFVRVQTEYQTTIQKIIKQ
jgi:hypothetical protein